MRALREACAAVAARARCVQIDEAAVPAYAASLPLPTAPAALPATPPAAPPDTHTARQADADRAAYWLTLDAINFGSGWFPTLRKRDGHSGYRTIALGLRERFEARGPWSAEALTAVSAPELADVLHQAPEHELMGLFAASLNDLGAHVHSDLGGRFEGVLKASGSSALELAALLGGWACFTDCSRYDGLTVPFRKRAQIAAADLARAGFALTGLDELTMFADNLVPHVLRLDGVLRYEPDLAQRIERGELIPHDSREEVEIRACALHAVELICAARPGARAMDVDAVLWHRGQEPRYKASPRHRSRCTAY